MTFLKNLKSFKTNSKALPRIHFVFSLCVVAFFYGFIVHRNQIFPYKTIKDAKDVAVLLYEDITGGRVKFTDKTFTRNIPVYDSDAAYAGPSLITALLREKKTMYINIIDMEGNLLQEWNIDWHEIWPKVTHIPKSDPKLSQGHPNTHIHGAELLDNGDVVFNFEHLGMVRVDVCGNVVWRLPYRTHHSIYKDENDTLWVSGQINHESELPEFPNHDPPFIEPTVIQVNLDGELLKEISVLDLLVENNLQGLLYMSTIDNTDTQVNGDTLHLNDVETFPSYLDEGVFKTGDIMISLRNINTVLVFRNEDRVITYLSIGEFVRQHDPDFLDGYRISVFDNQNIAPSSYGYQSRIIIKSFLDNQSSIYFTGDEEMPFYTNIMGKHQWLPNGNLLITESQRGRAFEIDPQGRIVWEFVMGDGKYWIVEEVQRVSANFTREFFEQARQECSQQ